jgi:GNAT superfamily N-acetyltransferase
MKKVNGRKAKRGADLVLEYYLKRFPISAPIPHARWTGYGYIAFYKTCDYGIKLTNFWVAPEVRGAGHGRRMLADLCEICDEHGVTITTYVERFDTRDNGLKTKQLYDFYGRFGFKLNYLGNIVRKPR